MSIKIGLTAGIYEVFAWAPPFVNNVFQKHYKQASLASKFKMYLIFVSEGCSEMKPSILLLNTTYQAAVGDELVFGPDFSFMENKFVS